MTQEEAALLLQRAAIFQHPCDLDLLLFFVGHPRTILTSELLATFLGYELKQIADSLEILLGAGLISRTQTSAHAARLYLLVDDGPDYPWLPLILEMGSTRKGRILLKKALALRRRGESDEPSISGVREKKSIGEEVAPPPLPFRADNSRSAVRRVRRRGGR